MFDIFDLEVENNYLFTMGSLEHAKTELLNLSTWKWKTSSPYFNYQQINSFEALFYKDKFYVIGGKTKTEILSLVARFDPNVEEWSRIGNLKFARFNLKADIIDYKLFTIGGLETPEYCDLTDFACSMFTDTVFKPENNPTLYAFYPSKCKLGILKIELYF